MGFHSSLGSPSEFLTVCRSSMQPSQATVVLLPSSPIRRLPVVLFQLLPPAFSPLTSRLSCWYIQVWK